MLKAKRIAKVILCFCFAFSMFISANAAGLKLIYSGVYYTGDNVINPGNNTIDDISVRFNTNVITNTLYHAILYYPSVTVNDYDKSSIQLSFYTKQLYNNYTITVDIDNNTITNGSNLIKNGNYYEFDFIIPDSYTIASNNNTKYYANYWSKLKNQDFTLNYNNENLVSIYEYYDDKTLDAVSIITEVLNNLINCLNSITSFITDKPWIILLGVTVSLLSFLIYKAKGII